MRSLQHPSSRGPLLELGPEVEPKGPGKNRMYLDLRLEPGDAPDAVAREVVDRGGREVHHPDWGDLPWRFFLDPSGNEFCMVPARGLPKSPFESSKAVSAWKGWVGK